MKKMSFVSAIAGAVVAMSAAVATADEFSDDYTEMTGVAGETAVQAIEQVAQAGGGSNSLRIDEALLVIPGSVWPVVAKTICLFLLCEEQK